MPFSDDENKAVVVEWYRRLGLGAFDTVVDIGAGAGTYSKLLRPHDDNPHPTWYAVDIWGPYVDQFSLHDHYDEVVITDVRWLDWGALPCPDLVIFGDVLEHMEKDEAKMVLAYAMDHARHVFVSVPVLHLPLGPWEGNPYETHVDHWTHEEMRVYLEEMSYGGSIRDSVVGGTLSYHWWSRPDG